MAATETTDLALGFSAPDFSLPNATEEGTVHAKDLFWGGPPWSCSCATIVRL